MSIVKYSIPAPPSKPTQAQLEEISVQSRNLCSHEYRVVRKIKSNGAITFRTQCRKCKRSGEDIPKGSLTAAQQRDAPEFEEGEYWQDEAEWRRQRIAKLEDTLRQNWWKWYNGYLASPEWKERRRRVMERAGGICECCRNERATEVHHLTYELVGREPLFHLVAICHSCHQEIEA